MRVTVTMTVELNIGAKDLPALEQATANEMVLTAAMQSEKFDIKLEPKRRKDTGQKKTVVESIESTEV